MTDIYKIFPISRDYFPELDSFLGEEADALPERLSVLAGEGRCPGFLPDLARVELTLYRLRLEDNEATPSVSELSLNSRLELLEVNWSPLLALLVGKEIEPQAEKQFLLFWRRPDDGGLCQCVATANDLLALKIVVENLPPESVAAEQGCPAGDIDRILQRAVSKGLLLQPQSKLRRQDDDFTIPENTPEKFLCAEAFTLQWHITHRCDLHCKHCYDRSRRDDVGLQQGLDVLDQMRAFCREHHVYGQVSFSGGNPFMHPDFFVLYRAACERNLNAAILGNPVSEEQLDGLLQIDKPVFYQVSLEGLQEHNDQIRGKGNFASVFEFLDLLKKKQIYSMVMLTLTQANMPQVLPLAEQLRDRVDLFTFNRLSMVGEGASLESPRPADYRTFVAEYLQAQRNNPAMALKDSLLNIEREKQQQGLFGGCTGFGCGAAFNFVSLLPDGQVHACRKFPSLIGDMKQQSLQDIYYSAAAKAYRQGCKECDGCRLRANCGGCLAVAYGYGLDPLRQKDPACFIDP
ncbi:selenobiotic family peptide radical SAM maturase [Malonomonas rubra DSM 5091]|uniref:Selenobiotic family peptide radical SAM maturase n=1 Tax=Malonomonas rubra DSM 5091 TaxID=1122189 RepID=A0A1M6DVV8_MALRU|nr:thio(seleno)oxazole modification radical SAM maturase SbtM [Malonomonas rubra]SHI77376.1 selenobiotic family peptide radical SAM maturase [Malonomonas rubra DSM 5091]